MWTRWWTSGFHKMLGSSRVAAQLAASQEGLSSMSEWVNNFLQTVGLLGRVISPSQGRYLNKGQHKQRINAYTQQTSMLWVGFEPMILASKQAKTVHASNRAAAVTGVCVCTHVRYHSAQLCWISYLYEAVFQEFFKLWRQGYSAQFVIISRWNFGGLVWCGSCNGTRFLSCRTNGVDNCAGRSWNVTVCLALSGVERRHGVHTSPIIMFFVSFHGLSPLVCNEFQILK
jgi:hypothetical protein